MCNILLWSYCSVQTLYNILEAVLKSYILYSTLSFTSLIVISVSLHYWLLNAAAVQTNKLIGKIFCLFFHSAFLIQFRKNLDIYGENHNKSLSDSDYEKE